MWIVDRFKKDELSGEGRGGRRGEKGKEGGSVGGGNGTQSLKLKRVQSQIGDGNSIFSRARILFCLT